IVEATRHAEFVTGHQAADVAARRSLDRYEAAVEPGGEQRTGVAPDLQASALHFATGTGADVALDDHRSLVELGADEIETARAALDLDRVARFSGDDKQVADRKAAFRSADHEAQHAGQWHGGEAAGRELRQVETLVGDCAQTERQTAHG